MTTQQAIERLEVMRDCYEAFFGSSDGCGFEAKYKENREAFDIAVSVLRDIPVNARLIDANELKADLQLFFNYEILKGLTAETLFMQILTDIDNAPTIMRGGES